VAGLLGLAIAQGVGKDVDKKNAQADQASSGASPAGPISTAPTKRAAWICIISGRWNASPFF